MVIYLQRIFKWNYFKWKSISVYEPPEKPHQKYERLNKMKVLIEITPQAVSVKWWVWVTSSGPSVQLSTSSVTLNKKWCPSMPTLESEKTAFTLYSWRLHRQPQRGSITCWKMLAPKRPKTSTKNSHKAHSLSLKPTAKQRGFQVSL